jgi:hypothetical protein
MSQCVSISFNDLHCVISLDTFKIIMKIIELLMLNRKVGGEEGLGLAGNLKVLLRVCWEYGDFDWEIYI